MSFDHPTNVAQMMKRHRWRDTSAHYALNTRTPESRQATAVCFTASSRKSSPADRWKRYLTLISHGHAACK
jgi:hypothetical protein